MLKLLKNHVKTQLSTLCADLNKVIFLHVSDWYCANFVIPRADNNICFKGVTTSLTILECIVCSYGSKQYFDCFLTQTPLGLLQFQCYF